MKTAPVANKSDKAIKPRGGVAETLLQAWMTLSMVSLLPLMYFSGMFVYFILTSGALESLDKQAVLPAEQVENLVISTVLLANYVLFKLLCKVVIHPRLGVGAMLRSDAKKLQATEGQ